MLLACRCSEAAWSTPCAYVKISMTFVWPLVTSLVFATTFDDVRRTVTDTLEVYVCSTAWRQTICWGRIQKIFFFLLHGIRLTWVAQDSGREDTYADNGFTSDVRVSTSCERIQKSSCSLMVIFMLIADDVHYIFHDRLTARLTNCVQMTTDLR